MEGPLRYVEDEDEDEEGGAKLARDGDGAHRHISINPRARG